MEITMDPKRKKKLYTLLSKMTNIFLSFYIIKPSFIITKDNESPYMIDLEPVWIELFEELFGKFDMVCVRNIKNLKKVLNGPKEKDDINTFPKLEDQFYIVTSKRETFEISTLLKDRQLSILNSKTWNSFLLDNNEEKNAELIRSIFTDNDYIRFQPNSDIEVPVLILTKSLLPLVTEKNYTDLYYSVQEIIEKKLYLIIFDLQFELFRLYMYHTYIPFDENGQSNKE